MRRNFHNYKSFFALLVDRLGDNFLRSAVAVHLRNVDQTLAKLNSQTQRCDFPVTYTLSFAHAPRLLSEGMTVFIVLVDRIPSAAEPILTSVADLVPIVLAAAIWIPYVSFSKRVKATFRY